jgi:hypothetical protein
MYVYSSYMFTIYLCILYLLCISIHSLNVSVLNNQSEGGRGKICVLSLSIVLCIRTSQYHNFTIKKEITRLFPLPPSLPPRITTSQNIALRRISNDRQKRVRKRGGYSFSFIYTYTFKEIKHFIKVFYKRVKV